MCDATEQTSSNRASSTSGVAMLTKTGMDQLRRPELDQIITTFSIRSNGSNLGGQLKRTIPVVEVRDWENWLMESNDCDRTPHC